MRSWSRSLVLAAFVASVGCTAPERHRTYQPEFDEALARADDEASEATGTPVSVDGAAFASGEALVLSLERATVLALENNRDLAVRRLSPVVAGTFDLIERGVFDPELFAELSFLNERSSETSRDTGQQFAVEGTEAEFEAGVRQTLPTGTTFEASVRQDRTASDRAPEQQEARFGLTVTQSLLRGLGPAANLVRVRQAELDEQAGVAELRAFVQALVADVRIAYWQLVLAEREIDIFTESLDVARRQLDDVQEKIEVGFLPAAEAPAAEVEVARREQALIDARAEVAERRLRLLRLLGGDALGGLDVEVEVTGALSIRPTPVHDLDDRLRLAVRSRPELAEARLRHEQDRLETVLTRDGIQPRLDLFARLDRTGFDDELVASFRDVDGKNGELRVGLSLSYLLGNRTALGRHERARAERREAALAIHNLEERVRFEVRLAALEVDRAARQIAVSRRTRELQERLLTAEQERFQVGASTGLLVAQAQRDLLAARIAEVESEVDHRIALLRLSLAEGSLLERSGIRVGDSE